MPSVYDAFLTLESWKSHTQPCLFKPTSSLACFFSFNVTAFVVGGDFFFPFVIAYWKSQKSCLSSVCHMLFHMRMTLPVKLSTSLLSLGVRNAVVSEFYTTTVQYVQDTPRIGWRERSSPSDLARGTVVYSSLSMWSPKTLLTWPWEMSRDSLRSAT